MTFSVVPESKDKKGDKFSTEYEAYVYLRDVLKMKGKVLDDKGKDVTEQVIPKNRLDSAKAPNAEGGKD